MSVPLQVTIEVVVDPQDELEMDLMAEPKPGTSMKATLGVDRTHSSLGVEALSQLSPHI